ncbi:hypothetical protein NHJ13051_004185 [Beauveria bassiana]
MFLSLGLSKLLIGAHNEEKGKTAIADPATIESWPLDLASYDSVVAFAKRVESLERVDYILNAGMCATTFRINESTGHEETIQAKRAVLTRRAYPHFRRLVVGRVQLDLVQPAFACALDKGTGDFTDRILVSKLLSQFYTLELSKEGDDG